MPPTKAKTTNFRDPKAHRDPVPILFPKRPAETGSRFQLDDSTLKRNVAMFLDIREVYKNTSSNNSSDIVPAKPSLP